MFIPRSRIEIDESKWSDIPIPDFPTTLERPPFFTWVQADTASDACPAHPGSLDFTSRTLAAVMFDAGPCSVNTAYEPELSFTTSPHCSTRPSHIWNFLSNSEFWSWHQYKSVAK